MDKLHKKRGYDFVISRSKAWFCSIKDFNLKSMNSKWLKALNKLIWGDFYSAAIFTTQLCLQWVFPYLTSPCTLATAPSALAVSKAPPPSQGITHQVHPSQTTREREEHCWSKTHQKSTLTDQWSRHQPTEQPITNQVQSQRSVTRRHQRHVQESLSLKSRFWSC